MAGESNSARIRREAKEVLVKFFPPKSWPSVSRRLDRLFSSEDDDALWLIQILVVFQFNVKARLAVLEKEVRAINHPLTWKRKLIQTLVAWLVIPLVISGTMVSAFTLYAHKTHQNSEAIAALAEILRVPGLTIRTAPDGKAIAIGLPKDLVKEQEGDMVFYFRSESKPAPAP